MKTSHSTESCRRGIELPGTGNCGRGEEALAGTRQSVAYSAKDIPITVSRMSCAIIQSAELIVVSEGQTSACKLGGAHSARATATIDSVESEQAAGHLRHDRRKCAIEVKLCAATFTQRAVVSFSDHRQSGVVFYSRLRAVFGDGLDAFVEGGFG
jgi:hypothetical protein